MTCMHGEGAVIVTFSATPKAIKILHPRIIRDRPSIFVYAVESSVLGDIRYVDQPVSIISGLRQVPVEGGSFTPWLYYR